MAGFITKIIVCPLVVLFSWLAFANVHYEAVYQPIIVGLILAVAAHMMEVFLLRPGRFWVSTVMDFVAAAVIIYIASNMFAGAAVTFLGAMLAAFLLTVTEYFQHQWLIKSGRTEKSPS